MPVMSRLEQAWCRSLAWRSFTRRVVFPWALEGEDLHGDVLELGSGSGAMAAVLLDRYPDIRLSATDVDPAMLDAARRRLGRFGDRVTVREADATRLPFDDGSFDAVVSFIMLHHVIDWEAALAEVARVLRPGGRLAGYDLVLSGPARVLHRFDRSPHRLATVADLRERLRGLAVDRVEVRPGLGGLVARFTARRPANTDNARATETGTTR
jgi:ubiquinone/menaquinone biosynthesis C-methylase UbiE